MSDIAPTISIIIPVYNVELYLRQCLDSMVNQTLREIQIICVDNGSTDRSWQILQEYAAKDERFLILSHPGGRQGAVRNAAYPHIQGEYTTFVDSDDWIDLRLSERSYTILNAIGADVFLLNYYEHAESDSKIRLYSGVQRYFPITSSDSTVYLDYLVAPWARVVRFSFLKQQCLSEDNFYHLAIIVNEPQILFGARLGQG